jgi:hypothetical protein
MVLFEGLGISLAMTACMGQAGHFFVGFRIMILFASMSTDCGGFGFLAFV